MSELNETAKWNDWNYLIESICLNHSILISVRGIFYCNENISEELEELGYKFEEETIHPEEPYPIYRYVVEVKE